MQAAGWLPFYLPIGHRASVSQLLLWVRMRRKVNIISMEQGMKADVLQAPASAPKRRMIDYSTSVQYMHPFSNGIETDGNSYLISGCSLITVSVDTQYLSTSENCCLFTI